MRANLRYILLLALSVMLYGCSGDSSKTHYSYEEYGLNCPVKSVRVLTYEAKSKFGEVTKGDLSWSGNYMAQFNEVGNIKELSTYNAIGDLNDVTKFKYNDNNQLVENAMYNSDGELEYQLSIEYDDDHIIRTTNRNYWSGGEEVHIWTNLWDGDKIKEQCGIMNGELTSKTIYHVAEDYRSEWTTYNIDSEHHSDKVYSGYEIYNEEGQITNYCYTEGEKVLKDGPYDFCMEVRYNEHNLPIYLKNASLTNNTIIVWHTEGEEVEYYVEYKYDSKGNWIEQIVYEGFAKKPVSISEREINY